MFEQNLDSVETDDLDASTLHDLLADERRRHALDCLSEHGSMSLPDLADETAAREHDQPLPRVPEDAVLTVYLSLYHTHVPKLVETGLVSHDRDCGVVSLADDATVSASSDGVASAD